MGLIIKGIIPRVPSWVPLLVPVPTLNQVALWIKEKNEETGELGKPETNLQARLKFG